MPSFCCAAAPRTSPSPLVHSTSSDSHIALTASRSAAESARSWWSKWQASTLKPSCCPSSRRTMRQASESGPPETATRTLRRRRNKRSRSANLRTSRTVRSKTGLAGEKSLEPGPALFGFVLDWGTGDHKDRFSFAPKAELATRLLFNIGIGGDVFLDALDVSLPF